MRHALLLSLLLCSATSCRGGLFASKTTITSADGRHKIEVPMGWSSAPNLNERAEIGAENKIDELFAIVISEPKASFSSMTLDRYSDTTRAALEKHLEGPTDSGPHELTLHGRRALQAEVSGKYGKVDLAYLHTAVETKDRLNQVIVWTVKSRAQQAHSMFEDIVASFDEAGDGGR